MIHLLDSVIDRENYLLDCEANHMGSLVEFSGIVRGEEKGQSITSLSYQVYPGMTEKKLEEVEAEIRHEFPIIDMVIVHRYGDIAVGEVALWIQIATSHRKESFEALEKCIVRIKEIVPIWKLEPGHAQ